MKLFEAQHVFNAPWNLVSVANWSKYPNKNCPHVTAVDVVDRRVDPNTGVLYTERIIKCKQSAPAWAMKLLGGQEDTYIREISEVDPNSRVLRMTSKNMSLSHFLTVQEVVTYKPAQSDPHHTVFNQEAKVTAYGFFSTLARKIEDMSVDRFKENAIKGRQGFESVLQSLGFMDEPAQKIENQKLPLTA